MKKLIVQDYLLSGGTIESLYNEHGVKLKLYNGKASLTYDQKTVKDDDPLACQCRGLILREGTWEIVAYPFDRFFNHGQPTAANIDWAKAQYEEKLDGTLLIVYWDDLVNKWLCGTRSMCEAHGDINGVGSFAELADRAAIKMGASSLNDLMIGSNADKNKTYIFELTSPYNQIVCQYSELKLTLIGVRDIGTHLESHPEDENFETIQTWKFSSVEDLIEVIKDWDPTQYEGIVAKDKVFNRVKVKSPKYLAVAHATDSLSVSWRSVCEAVMLGTVDDIKHMMPLLVQERITIVQDKITKLFQETEQDWQELKGIEDIKEFALAAQKRIWPSALFSLKRNKAKDLDEVLSKTNPNSIINICKIE